MKKATFSIVGRKIFLYHKFNIEAITDTQKPKVGSSGNNTIEWKTTVFAEENKLYIPDTYFFATIVAGGKYVKLGRGTVSKNVASTLEICKERFYIENRELPKNINDCKNEDLVYEPEKNVYIDCRMVANPNTKGRNIRYRVAMSPGWKTSCEIRWDETVVSEDQIKLSVECAGKFVGIGDGLVIGLGRFDTEDWKIVK